MVSGGAALGRRTRHWRIATVGPSRTGHRVGPCCRQVGAVPPAI